MKEVKDCDTCCNFYAGADYKLCKECKPNYPHPTNWNVSENEKYMVIDKRIWDMRYKEV